ncbi:golgin subfamily A member 6-like protein 22 isoform X1 [Austrofundulus limnaeus]|uniref:Golgin subfamily A member 6-like protein 22 isoform X1 n=1 Tax=Austrofundulus limnaeus TaxID=52670 RepID=A0A2I4CAI3_AUSLI|nr:PREDICTED: golgin subfamily A member 6-like protein 22 isoform X1 [Austrofundulus limnaeus]
MWDSSSHFAAQSSAWCGSAAVTGSGFLSNIRARQSDPGLRRWQSMYNLAHESPARWSPLSGAELRAGGAGRSFYQTEVEQWLQDAHEHLITELDWVRPRDTRLSYNTSRTRMPDVKQKVLKPNWDLDAADLSPFDHSREQKELQEKVQKLESDLLQMRLDKRSNDSHSRTHSNTQENETVDKELREAEARASTREEERKKVLEDLQASEENQRMWDQIEEMSKRLKKNSEVQEELREANNKLSQAYLDKSVLSTQVLKLEDNIKKVEIKLTEAQSANNHLIQEKNELLLKVQNLEVQLQRTTENSQKTDPSADSESQNEQETELMEDLKTLKEINKKLRKEVEVLKKSVDSSQCELQELKEERITNSKHLADLQAERSQLIREKEELLSRTNQVLTETKEKGCQHRASADMLESEAQKLRGQCASLEAQVQQKEEMLHLQDDEHRRQDEMRVRCIEELKAETSHWTQKWQTVALSLQATKNQLEELKNNSINKKESENRRTQTVKDEGGEPVQTVDRQTLTDSSESSLIHQHPSECPQNKSLQLHQQEWLESSEIQRLRQKLAEKVKEDNERKLALSRLERLREKEKTESEIKISALELQLQQKEPEDCGEDEGLLADASGSLSMQPDDSRRTRDETIQEHQTRHESDKNNKGSVEGKKDKLICPINPEMELQRRMVAEQLKSLFKEREDKNPPAAAKDWTPPAVRAGGDRRSWQQGSGLMPVFEEDEEDCDSPEEEEDAAEDSQAEVKPCGQRQSTSL